MVKVLILHISRPYTWTTLDDTGTSLREKQLYSHNVPSTSKTTPFNTGLSSPSFFFEGFSGANRRGRPGAMVPALLLCK